VYHHLRAYADIHSIYTYSLEDFSPLWLVTATTFQDTPCVRACVGIEKIVSFPQPSTKTGKRGHFDMKKTTRNKTNTRKRTYTVQEQEGVPSLRIRGKWLEKELGIDIGTRLQLIPGKNKLILRKIPETIVKREKAERQLAIAEKEAAYYRAILQY